MRLDKSVAGPGSHGDLGAHLIDAARFLVGEFDQVMGVSKTFIKERPIVEKMIGLSGKAKDSSARGKVTVDDAEGVQGFRTIQVTEGVHPYMEAWWPAGHVIGYEHTFVHEMYEYVESITKDTATTPDFNDGVKLFTST